MSKRKVKETVWRDTNIYPFAIQYEYPMYVDSRCLFFWATTLKSWKAIINLAAELAVGNKISVVYLYGDGDAELVKKHIDKLGNPRLIVLWADYIAKERLTAIKTAIAEIGTLRKWGLILGEEPEARDIFDNDYEQNIRRVAANPDEHISVIQSGRAEAEAIKQETLQRGYKQLMNITPLADYYASATAEGHISYLKRMIKNIYPFGAEADTTEDYAYKVLHFERLCRDGMGGDYKRADKLGVRYREGASGGMQMSLFDDTSLGIRAFVDEFRRICDRGIAENGFTLLADVVRQMMSPPYGMYECNYYGLCVGIALQKYRKGYYIGELLTSGYSEYADIPKAVTYTVQNLAIKRLMPFYIYTQTEKQIQLAKRLRETFPPDYDAHNGTECVQSSLTYVRSWITKHVHYDSIQRAEPKLFEMTSLWAPCVYSKKTEEYAEWLTTETAERVKTELEQADDKFFEMLAEKYGRADAELYRKSQYVKDGGIGWTSTTEYVDGRVEWYMKQLRCRECGAILQKEYQVHENDDFSGGRIEKLTQQNIINLNKKMLGRYQKEYFCPRCLCEVLDTTEWGLYEKIQDFKQQGCELF